ncbi:MAG: hypothetical protein AAGH15_15680 [Myxococcota bacterium]
MAWTRSAALARGLLVACLAAACGDGDPPAFLDDGTAYLEALPERLSEVGLYPDAPDLARTHPAVVRYTPRFPLWTNGSFKSREVALPEGGVVTFEGEQPVFPVGTLLFKTFGYASGPVETRVMRREADGEWSYAVYLWEGNDATLRDITLPLAIPVADAGERFDHETPSRRQCVTCHESDPNPVLGFDRLQLSDELGDLADQGLFATAPEGVSLGGDAGDRAILAYFVGNCVHCHNGEPGLNNGFDLRPDVARANLVGQPTMASGVPPGLRVAPGDADASVIVQALAQPDGSFAMPPLGVQRADAEFLTTLRAWIDEMTPMAPPENP